jgi:NADPH:quinone reductase-like Zn-dependent oxidoreductase
VTASQVATPGKAAGVANRHPHDPRAHEAHPHGPHPRQAMLLEPGRLELREVSPPHPGAGAILVEIKCALSCGTDLKTLLIRWKLPSGLNSRWVAEVGEGVERFKPGDAMAALTAPAALASTAIAARKIYARRHGPDGDGGVRRHLCRRHRCAQHLRETASAFEEAACRTARLCRARS